MTIMHPFFSTHRKIGILGGGQLGKMLALAAAPWDLHLKILDPSADAPARHFVKEFQVGDFRDYDTVLQFGSDCEVLTIEIEDVNTDALCALQQQGKKIFPQPEIIEIFQDKTLQKKFYSENHFPTSPYLTFGDKQQLLEYLTSDNGTFPKVWKAARGGFDGRGVAKLRSLADTAGLQDSACILEEHVDIWAETAVIVHRNAQGQVVSQPMVQMEFHPEAHFVELVFAPSVLDHSTELKCMDIATRLVEKLNLVGTLAVEFFITPNREILINEAAPRVHNSGHLTIEAVASSQFEQHIRAITGLHPGANHLLFHAAMLNLTGHPKYEGSVLYEGAERILSMPMVFMHLYGKPRTKPYRKMGHITAIGDDVHLLIAKIKSIKDLINVISY
ncbi:MAG: 5-(carboxyamino)imidazole ribonucleotide synthase [Thermaurantimonas sp.]